VGVIRFFVSKLRLHALNNVRVRAQNSSSETDRQTPVQRWSDCGFRSAKVPKNDGILISIFVVIFVKVDKSQLIHRSIRVFIQRASSSSFLLKLTNRNLYIDQLESLYNKRINKITTEKHVSFIDKLSVVASWSKVTSLIRFIREQRG